MPGGSRAPLRQRGSSQSFWIRFGSLAGVPRRARLLDASLMRLTNLGALYLGRPCGPLVGSTNPKIGGLSVDSQRQRRWVFPDTVFDSSARTSTEPVLFRKRTARLDSLVIDSATELLLTVSRTPALTRVHPCHEVSTLVGIRRSPLPKPRLEPNCSGLSRSGAHALRKAPPDSSPGAPSSPLPPAVLTGFPQLPRRECSTSRSCSVQRFDVRQWC